MERKYYSFLVNFLRSFLKTCFMLPEERFELQYFFKKKFRTFLKVLGNYQKLFEFFCPKLKAGGPKFILCVPKSNPRKSFFGKKVKKGILSKIFQNFGQIFLVSSGLSDQQSTKPEEQTAGKIFFEETSILCFFRDMSVKFRFLPQTLGSLLPKRVPKNKPGQIFFVDKKTGKNRSWATFYRTLGQKLRRGCQNCNLDVKKSISRY